MIKDHLIAKTRPVANEKNVVFWKDYRVSVLADRLFRVEQSKNKKFRDAATQSVWFRDMPPQSFCVSEKDGFFLIQTEACTLALAENREDCYVEIGGKKTPICNEGNLLGTYRTLDQCNGSTFIPSQWNKAEPYEKPVTLENGVCSKTGVAVYDDAASVTLLATGQVCAERGDGTDEYVFAYGDDYRSAVKALFMITGSAPLVPRFALGNWWSRYYAYTQEEYLTLLENFEQHDVPLTVATIDMDWHYSIHLDEQKRITEQNKNTEYYGGNNGWTGYSWNTDLFPDYKQLLAEIQDKNLKITLNLHPADGVRWFEDSYEKMANAMGLDATTQQHIKFDIFDETFLGAYFDVLHKPYEKDGVAFWWIDWQQGTAWGKDGLDPLWPLNHYHYLDNALNNQTPLILSRYSGVGSHRYPLGFSGDTHVTWETLDFLPYFTATSSNVGYTWWSHDIGGHMFGEKSDELYLRHVQYGVFSPINRLHSSNSRTQTKEPWAYLNGAGEIAMQFMRLRHRLIPFLYTQSHRTARQGIALVEPLYYEWKCPEAYEYKNEYLFGGLLVAPVTQKCENDGYARVPVWLPEGEWTDFFTGDEYHVGKGGKRTVLHRTKDHLPLLMKAGTVLPLSSEKGNSVQNPKTLDVFVYNGNGEFTLVEDGRERGESGEFFTEFSTSCIEQDGAGKQTLCIRSRGDETIIPSGRTLDIYFKNLQDGDVCLKINGKTEQVKRLRKEEVTVRIPFESGKTYEIAVSYAAVSPAEKFKNAVRRILLVAECTVTKKDELYHKINALSSVDEMAQAVRESDVPNVVKLRLLETL